MRRMFMYSPKIKDELVKNLYQLKMKTNIPMTKLVNEAVIEYLEKRSKEDGLCKNGNKDTG
jgi:predicted transcriptional regulator